MFAAFILRFAEFLWVVFQTEPVWLPLYMRWAICHSIVFLLLLLYCGPNRGRVDAASRSCSNSPILSCEIIDDFAGDLLTNASIENEVYLIADNQTTATTTTVIDWGRFKPIDLRTLFLYKVRFIYDFL